MLTIILRLYQIIQLHYPSVMKIADEPARGIADFVLEVKDPVIKMVKLYLAQAVMTATYIYSLSCVGKFWKF